MFTVEDKSHLEKKYPMKKKIVQNCLVWKYNKAIEWSHANIEELRWNTNYFSLTTEWFTWKLTSGLETLQNLLV